MNSLIAFFARQHTLVNILTVFVFVVGVFATINIKREVFPNIDFDAVRITTAYPRASAESVEALITNKLERRLTEVEGVDEMTSVSVEGRSVITLKLDPDQTDIIKAKADASDVVEKVTDLPEDAEDPVVVAVENRNQPILEIALSGGTDYTALRQVAKATRDRIENLDEVASVNTQGLWDREIRVLAQPEKMRQLRVTLGEIIAALRRANINFPAGTYINGATGENAEEYVIRTFTEVAAPKDIGAIVIRSNIAGRFITIADVAETRWDYGDDDTRYRTNGKEAINLTVVKKQSADAITLVEKVRALMASTANQLPPEIHVTYLNDRSVRVKTRLQVLSSNLLIGLILVVIILTIFLPFRVAMVTGVGIPFSFLATLIYFYGSDVSINLLSMMGLIIVLGMLVDDAIVVTENIQRHMDEGKSPADAAELGTQEIWKPVLSSVLTTMCAFIPMLYMTGIMGKFVGNIPIGVLAALVVSLLECFFILPSHVADWVKIKATAIGKPRRFSPSALWERLALPTYLRLLRVAVRLRYLGIFATIGLLLFSLYWAKSHLGFRLFPGSENDDFTLAIETAPKRPLAYTLEKVKQLESLITDAKIPEVIGVSSVVGMKSGGGRSVSSRGGQYAYLKVYVKPGVQRQRKLQPIINDLKAKITAVEGVEKMTFTAGRAGPPVGKDISLEIRGDDYDTILAAAAAVEKLAADIPGVGDVANSYISGKDEVIISVDEAKLSLAGISKLDVAQAVRASFDGLEVDSIDRLDEEIKIFVSLPKSALASIDEILAIKIPNQRGQTIELGRFASTLKSSSIAALEHKDRKRVVRVEAEVDKQIITSADATSQLSSLIKEVRQNYPNLDFTFGGSEKDRRESLVSLGRAFIFAFFGIILLLILQFNNVVQPMIIGLLIPLSTIGVIWSFYAHGMPLSFLGIIGIIALGGVIVNNGIVFIDFFNQSRAAGTAPQEAVLAAAQKRLRPIFLTTITTVSGILPTAYGIGGRDDFVVPIAMALGWGILFGSLLTTFVLPIILSIYNDIGQLWRRMWAKIRPQGV